MFRLLKATLLVAVFAVLLAVMFGWDCFGLFTSDAGYPAQFHLAEITLAGLSIKQLREKKGELATEIKRQATEFNERKDAGKLGDELWPDNTRDQFQQVNDDFNAVNEAIEQHDAAAAEAANVAERMGLAEEFLTSRTVREHVPGVADTVAARGGDGSTHLTGPTERQRCLGLQAWCRMQAGSELSDEHIEACRATGINPNRRELELQLPGSDFVQRAAAIFRDGHHTTAQARALSTLVVSEGGATVPEGFVNRLEINMLAFGGMLQVSEIVRTTMGNDLPWPNADDTSNEGEIVGQNAAQNDADPTFGAVTLKAHKFSSKFIKVPYELLEDSAFDLASILGGMIGERLGRHGNNKFTTGSGGGVEPQGIVDISTQGKEAASATAITDTELVELEHSVDPAYRMGARWMAHDNTWLKVRLLQDSDGQFVWRAGLVDGQPDRLLGYPITTNQHMASALASDNKTLLFGQLSKYKIRQVRGIRLKRADERFCDNDQVAFIGFLRQDGNLIDAGTAPVKHLKQAT